MSANGVFTPLCISSLILLMDELSLNGIFPQIHRKYQLPFSSHLACYMIRMCVGQGSKVFALLARYIKCMRRSGKLYLKRRTDFLFYTNDQRINLKINFIFATLRKEILHKQDTFATINFYYVVCTNKNQMKL